MHIYDINNEVYRAQDIRPSGHENIFTHFYSAIAWKIIALEINALYTTTESFLCARS